VLFLNIIFFENPITVIEKLSFFEKVVSPPQSLILYFFCSSLTDLLDLLIFLYEKVFLLPDPEIK
jgi:hypothetical protein